LPLIWKAFYAAGSVLIKTKLPRFYIKQGSSTPTNLMGRVQTILEPCVFRARPSVPPQKVANGDIWFFTETLEPRVLPWQQHSRCHSVSFVMYISGAKFEETCCNISRVILDWMLCCFSGTTYDVITFLICIIQKTWISLTRKKIFQKGKRHSSLLWKAFQISRNHFLHHSHFKTFKLGIFCQIWSWSSWECKVSSVMVGE